MEAMRQSWTDERLDDLNAKVARQEQVNGQFHRVDWQFEQMGQRLDRIEGRLGSMQAGFERRFDSLQSSMIYAVVGMFGAVTAGFVAIIATQL
jgi:uncharacterized coiled-coil protein SlyX